MSDKEQTGPGAIAPPLQAPPKEESEVARKAVLLETKEELFKSDGAPEEKIHVDYYMSEFLEGECKGLKYAHPGFKSGTEAIKHWGMDGEAIVADLVNSRVKLAIASKVKTNKLPRNVTPEQAQKIIDDLVKADTSGRGLIFTVEEAAAYRPGEREPGIKDQVEDLISNYKNMSQEEIIAALIKLESKKRVVKPVVSTPA